MSETVVKKKPGRKPGEHKLYPHQHGARFTTDGWRRLQALARENNISEAQVIRDAVDEKALREGVE